MGLKLVLPLWVRLGLGIMAIKEWLHTSAGCPRDVMVKAMDCGIVVRESYSSHAITFTFGQIPLGKAWTPLILPAMG